MNIGNTPVWQVAAGDTNRNYADLCLDWDVILNGPGSEGPWPACAEVLRTDWGLSSRKTTDLQRFAEDIAEGDYVVLRMGTTDVLGFGVVVGHYEWNDAFGDVDGWDLQHVRRVKWLWKYAKSPQTFPTYTMKLGDTVQRLDAPLVKDWIANLSIDQQAIGRPLVELPEASATTEWARMTD